MDELIIYTKVREYIKQWLIFKYGDPVRFKKASAPGIILDLSLLGNKVMKSRNDISSDMLAIKYTGSVKYTDKGSLLLKPDSDAKLRKCLKLIFEYALWNDLGDIFFDKSEMKKRIEIWCRKNGISHDYYESVISLYYRIKPNL